MIGSYPESDKAIEKKAEIDAAIPIMEWVLNNFDVGSYDDSNRYEETFDRTDYSAKQLALRYVGINPSILEQEDREMVIEYNLLAMKTATTPTAIRLLDPVARAIKVYTTYELDKTEVSYDEAYKIALERAYSAGWNGSRSELMQLIDAVLGTRSDYVKTV